jgi:hypothetical protein
MKTKGLFLMLCWSLPFVGWSQSIDHWEAVVLAENQWRYRAGDPQLPNTWNQPGFNDMFWSEGNGGFGYGDGDDNTIVSPTISLYLRKEFTLTNTAAIAALTLYADYDDAFVGVFERRRNSPGQCRYAGNHARL